MGKLLQNGDKHSTLKRIFFGVTGIFPFILLPESSWAHSAERGIIMLLPTGYYLVGGAIAVTASFLVLAVLPSKNIQQLALFEKPLFSFPSISVTVPSVLSFVVLFSLIVIGFLGSSDPLSNILPLSIWTVWWVGFTVLQFFVGDMWKFFNPWFGPLAWLQRLTSCGFGFIRLPERLGYLPAIILFASFAWFELVDLAPEDPTRLATVVLRYWLINFVAILCFGYNDWMKRGEPFSIFFGLVGLCSPFKRSRKTIDDFEITRISLSWPGKSYLEQSPLPVTGILFVLMTLSTVSFDGFSKSFVWLSAMGINPLDFPGRSALEIKNTIGLLAAFLCLTLAYFLSVYFGHCLVKTQINTNNSTDFLTLCGKWIYSIIPISLVFHAAHYLTVLLVNGQYFVHSLNDPLGNGWQLFGDIDPVTTSFLSDYHSVQIIWNIQTLIIVIGHVIGIVCAHMLAFQQYRSHSDGAKAAIYSQIGLAMLMIGYTWFGLWLLSTASMG